MDVPVRPPERRRPEHVPSLRASATPGRADDHHGRARARALLGAEVGFAAAFGVIALSWAATGHPVLDPGAEVLVSEGSFLRVVVALGVIAVVAPVVEELLFRGVVAESLRRHGAVLAVGVSALLFALAHLRWSWEGVTYYGVCGVVL